MRLRAALPWLVTAGVLLAQLAPSTRAGDRKQRVERSIADLTSRVAAVRWPASSGSIMRLTILTTTDLADESDAVLGIAEFEGGNVGLYLARQVEETDGAIVLRRFDLRTVIESATRAQEMRSR